jgi:MoaA/NifB/PqqE/SkfB family radical SAM enzyme
MDEKTNMSPAESKERVERKDWKPRNAVWELTLACNLRCRHCGSSAGKARPNELSLDECLDVAGQLSDFGTELVTLSGGEPTLKPGWDKIAEALVGGGALVNMVTNGVYHNGETAASIADRALSAGMCNVGMSIDGPEEIHETIRGKGTFAKTISAIETFTAKGMRVGVLTTINQLNFRYLDQVRRIAMDSGATLWRLQLAKPMGEMKLNDDWVITPAQLMELIPLLARLKRAGGIHLAVGDSIGYYGPHDKTLRGTGWRRRQESWQGCQAGMQAIGIEADGGIKGCLSLQAKWGDTDPFVEGNVRHTRLADLWHQPGIFAFNRDFDPESLEGFCGTCKHGTVCRGGARCVSSSFLGHLNEDPYCFYRLASILNGNQEGSWSKSAAAAAAALVISLGTTGCLTSSEPDYGVTPDTGGSRGGDAAVETDTGGSDVAAEPDEFCCPEYGVQFDMVPQPPPDVQPDYGVPPDVQPEYGMPADIQDTAEPDVQMDYGLPPDVTTQDIHEPDAVNCEQVCCECEYGAPPSDAEWKECCDPCKDACCDCDYGEPPPAECCD